MKLRQLTYIFFIIALLGTSCTTYKNVPYFQDLRRDSITTEAINNFNPLTVQGGDLLAVHVTSMSHEADAIFNYNLERPSGASSVTGVTAVGSQNENVVYGYLVNADGNIKLPIIGDVKVAGMSTPQVAAELEEKLSGTLLSPVVDVRIQNFKVSVLGDVKSPGEYPVTNERLTVTEALALAGDLNTTGIRKNVLVVREINGKRQYITLDLTSKAIFSSPYYYLKNNDVIYVQPNKERVASSDSAWQRISLLLAALSIVVIYITGKR